MIKLKLLFFGCILLLMACANGEDKARSDGSEFNPDELEKLEKEVMRIHDEVMPKMSDIRKLQDQLEDRLDSTTYYTDKHIKELKRAQQGLEEADKSMWSWMYQYNLDSVKGKTEKKLYLVDERAEIREVKSKMLNSIDYAQKTLEDGKKTQ